MRRFRPRLLALPLLFVLAGSAQAQTLVTPFAGSVHDKDTLDGVRPVYGISGAYWPALPIGIELDFAFYPDFFPAHHPDGDHHVVGDLSTLGVNVIVGPTFGGREGPGFRPYLTGGFVLFRLDADEPSALFDIRGLDAGFDIGGGAMVLLGDHVGIRGDVRYLVDARERLSSQTRDRVHGHTVAFERFAFTRATAGLVWRF